MDSFGVFSRFARPHLSTMIAFPQVGQMSKFGKYYMHDWFARKRDTTAPRQDSAELFFCLLTAGRFDGISCRVARNVQEP